MDKCHHAPLFLAEVVRQLLSDDQQWNVKTMFNEFLPQLILRHAAEPIVGEFLRTFNEKFPEEKSD